MSSEGGTHEGRSKTVQTNIWLETLNRLEHRIAQWQFSSFFVKNFSQKKKYSGKNEKLVRPKKI